MNYLCPNPIAETAENLTTATLYHETMFGYSVLHVRDLKIEVVKYAQYDKAVRVTFIEKGKRKRVGFMQTSHASLVVLEGHTTINTKPRMETETRNGITIESTRYSSFDARWSEEFDAALVASSATVLRDFRGYNAHTGAAGEKAQATADDHLRARLARGLALIG